MRALLLVAMLCTLPPALAFADAAEAQLMEQGQRAYLAGDLLTAAHLFQQVLQTDPQNTLAIQFLHKILLGAATAVAPPSQDSIKDLVLPSVEFRDATFAAALDSFKQQAAKQSVSISFVPQIAAAQMQNRVTLSLSQIPFLEALRYLCQQNNAVYKVDPYAIVILPAAVAGSSPAVDQ